MDAAMLWAHGDGLGPEGLPRRVLVAPFAGRPGRERHVAGGNADRWYRGLGARSVTVVTDEGDAFGAALDGLHGPDGGDPAAGRRPDGGDLLVLPGGSPARLLGAIAPHRAALAAALGRGVVVSGASAGAMVLCGWTVLEPVRVRRLLNALYLQSGLIITRALCVPARGATPERARR